MRAYEKRDLSFPAVAGAWAGLLLLCLGVAVASRWTLRHFSKGAPRSPESSALPPEPRLQTQPLEDLRRLRAEEEAVLTGYGWVDRPKGVVRIPIERAMALVLQKGLPARKAAAEPQP